MPQSTLHKLWLSKRKASKLRISHSVISDFLSCYDAKIPGQEGIRTEHEKVEAVLNGGDLAGFPEKTEIRYGETAYTIWALGHRLGRWDIIEANIANWGNGDDGGGGSRFRNFEFECQVALRFLEEGRSVKPLGGSHEPEMVVDNFFSIECKRQYDIRGLLRNTIKARDQIGVSGRSGVLIVNIDDLDGLTIDPCDEDTIEAELVRVARVAQFGMGSTGSKLAGVIVEYVSDVLSVSSEGSYVHVVHNCSDPNAGLCHNILDGAIQGLTGKEDRDIRDPQIEVADRYPDDYLDADEPKYLAFYDSNI